MEKILPGRTTRALRSALLSTIAAMLFATHAVRASTVSTDITGMWWVPTESGWGVNITLQNDLAFATFFVYDAQRNPAQPRPIAPAAPG
jgi:hypothetical protein